MKKLLSLTLIAALLLTLAACGKPYAPLPNPALVLGEKYLIDLDYEQALLQFDQAIEIEPKNPRGYLGKADALLHLDRQPDAVQTLDTGAKATRGGTRKALANAKTEAEKSPIDGYIGLSGAYETCGFAEIALALLKRLSAEFPTIQRIVDAWRRLEEQHNHSVEIPSTTDNAAVFNTVATTTVTATQVTTNAQEKSIVGKWWDGVDPTVFDPTGIAFGGEKFVNLEFTQDNRIILSEGIMNSDVGLYCEGTYHTEGNKLYIDMPFRQEADEMNDAFEVDLTGIFEYDIQNAQLNLRWVEGQDLKQSFWLDSELRATLNYCN